MVVIDVSVQHIGPIFNGQACPLTCSPKTSVTNTLTCLTCQKNCVVLNMRNFVSGGILPSSSGFKFNTRWHLSSLRYVRNASSWYKNSPSWKLGIFHSKEFVMSPTLRMWKCLLGCVAVWCGRSVLTFLDKSLAFVIKEAFLFSQDTW